MRRIYTTGRSCQQTPEETHTHAMHRSINIKPASHPQSMRLQFQSSKATEAFKMCCEQEVMNCRELQLRNAASMWEVHADVQSVVPVQANPPLPVPTSTFRQPTRQSLLTFGRCSESVLSQLFTERSLLCNHSSCLVSQHWPVSHPHLTQRRPLSSATSSLDVAVFPLPPPSVHLTAGSPTAST